MNVSLRLKPSSAIALIDVLVALAILGILAAILLPRFLIEKRKAERIRCNNNLKWIGQAFSLWSNDHEDTYPMFVSETNGGSMEYDSGRNVWRHFLVMSNELVFTPSILFCPAEKDRTRQAAGSFRQEKPPLPEKPVFFLSNSNLSYFVSIISNKSMPQLLLAGDRNITNAASPRNGILEVTTNNPSGWTKEMHHEIGNIVLADGSVQQLSILRLQETIANTGLATNHLQMPILVP